MKFKLVENIYDNSNKKKRKKHSISPFMRYGFMNVPYEVQLFNHLNGTDTKEDSNNSSGDVTDGGSDVSSGECANCTGE